MGQSSIQNSGDLQLSFLKGKRSENSLNDRRLWTVISLVYSPLCAYRFLTLSSLTWSHIVESERRPEFHGYVMRLVFLSPKRERRWHFGGQSSIENSGDLRSSFKKGGVLHVRYGDARLPLYAQLWLMQAFTALGRSTSMAAKLIVKIRSWSFRII